MPAASAARAKLPAVAEAARYSRSRISTGPPRRFAFFQMSGNIVVAAAQKMQLQTIKGPAQFGEMRNDQRQAD